MNRFSFRWFAATAACVVLPGAGLLVGAQEVPLPVAPITAPKPSVSRVVVRTLVDGTGTVKATQIRESSGNSRLDEEAVQVVSKVWSFSPLKINGKGIEVWVNVPINFVQAETPVAPAALPEVVPVVPTAPVAPVAPVAPLAPESLPPANPASEPATGVVQAQPAASNAAQPPASAPLPEPAASAADVPASAATPTPAASGASTAN